MNTDREIMQRALEALEWVNTSVWLEDCYHAFDEEVAALRDRLAQPEQEPVAHTLNCVCGAVWDISLNGAEEMVHTPDAPKPRREWVGLTDEEKAELDAEHGDDTLAHLDAIEAKLREKNA